MGITVANRQSSGKSPVVQILLNLGEPGGNSKGDVLAFDNVFHQVQLQNHVID